VRKAPASLIVMPLLTTLLSFARKFGLFVAMLAAMLACGDQFPFSNFPMYSVLPETVICMRLTDTQGKMIPSVPAFNVGTTILKKQMARELQTMKAEGRIKLVSDPPLDAAREAGQRVLDWVLKNHPPREAALTGTIVRLEQVTYAIKKGAISQRVDVIGEGMTMSYK